MKKNFPFLRRMTALFVVFAFLVVTFSIGVETQNAQEQSESAKLIKKFSKIDAVTNAVRARSSETVIVHINNFEDRERVGNFGTIVEDYGSFVVLSKDGSANFSGSNLDFQPLETSINLPSGAFEPLNESRPETIKPGSKQIENSGEKNYYIVQFGGIATQEWTESLRAFGAEILQYVPNQAFFVYADGAAISKISNHSRVRWVGGFTAEEKISPELTDFTRSIEGETAQYDVAVFAREDLAVINQKLTNSVQGKILNNVKLPNNFFNVVRIETSKSELIKIAAIPGVVRIDPFIQPTTEDERSSQIIAGNYTSPTQIAPPGYNPLTQFGVDGTNVSVSVVDDGVSIPGNGGFYVTSANTLDGHLRGVTAGAAGGHGHINASIISGNTPFGILDPQGYNYGVGVAPRSHIINIPFLKSGYQGSYLETVNDTVATNGVNGIKGTITNNSWGSGTNSNSYDSLAAQYDGFAQDASIAATIDPILVVFSAGNSGASGLTRPKMSKNTIAVANAFNIRPELSSSATNMDNLSSSSSRGPAADGRIKPDITAPGSVITGSRAGSCGSVSSCFDANHAWSSGTSHAAPQVAGAAALFTQFWKNTNDGVNPSPALVKAAIINTGQEMNGNLTTAMVPNGNEGWGRMNMKFMLNTGVAMKYVDQNAPFFNPGESIQYSGTIADSSKPVRFTLVWTDPPGVSNPALVNDLNLTVTIGANTYRGNVFTNGVSTTGGTADIRNNVENIFLPAGIPVGTPVTIQVSALALNGNGILGNADPTDQHFSLVAYNFSEPDTNTNKASDFDGDGKADIAVYRPSNGTWYVFRSSDNTFTGTAFGASADVIVPGDYDGDGKTDVAVFRPSSGVWYLNQSNAGFFAMAFGQNGDIPVAADYDGDGKADIAVFRPSNGVWYIQKSSGGFESIVFGQNGDVPVPADYNSDGKADTAIFRPSNGTWYIARPTGIPSQNFDAIQFGLGTDKPVQADYDGDGKADVAVFRPSNGTWYILGSAQGFSAYTFGTSTDLAAPADFDGDGKADINVYRSSNGVWYRTNSSNNAFNAYQFGANGDKPVAAGYVPAQ